MALIAELEMSDLAGGRGGRRKEEEGEGVRREKTEG